MIMMISPDAYYDMYLVGKDKEEVLDIINELKSDIQVLKLRLERYQCSNEYCSPSDNVRIKMNREYLVKAIEYYETLGGKYEFNEIEQQSNEFN